MIPVELSRIVISENSNQQIIWLKETQGERNFPIIIGFFEAMAIERNIKQNSYERPLTHDLLARVIVQLGGKLERLEVTKIKDNTFYANMILSRNGQTVELDCRPSDGIALASGFQAPIFVAEEVIDEVHSQSAPPDAVDFPEDEEEKPDDA